MAGGSKHATIVEIARLANTSTATVSRVLSGSDYPVSDALRAAVTKAAEEIGYVPNAFGQSLKIGKSNDIGVIVPNFSNPFYVQLISGIEAACRQEGYNPIFCSSNNSSDQELASMELLRRKCVEGLILSSISQSPDEIKRAITWHKNVVLFDQETSVDPCDYVSFDFENAGFLAIQHLLRKGHRNIAFLTAPLEDRASRAALYSGCMRAIEQWNGDAKCTLVCSSVQAEENTAWEYENGRNLVKLFLELEDRPTAVFVYNDMTAFSVLSQLAAEGLRIPEDVSVVGFDNILMSEYTTPPLTTITQPAFETGEMAARIIIGKINKKRNASCHIKFAPTLVERKSVKDLNV